MLESIILLGMPGGWEWLLIAGVVLLFFGAKRIPEMMRGLGSGIREFKKAKDDITDQLKEGLEEDSTDS